jgi:filamentous hemagglutinin family protein
MRTIHNLTLLSTLACASHIAALPSGLEIVSGDALTSSVENVLTIESGKTAILQWNDFSISKNEIAKFIQQDRHSMVLNRVVGGSESSILGLLESNGRVYLINPNGVFIGPGGRVETSGFLASTFDVLDEEFLRGDSLFFSGNSDKPIHNLGTIFCPEGNIHLFAAHIVNEGDLQAPQGRVGFSSGSDILLQKDGSSNIYIRPLSSEEVKEGAAIDHRGTISALTVELQAGANLYAKAIQCSGMIEASCIQETGGDIRLVAERGLTEINGGTLVAVGGKIHVLGEQVALVGRTEIDVSGETGGGTILVGGDFQGNNPDIQNSKQTFVSNETILKADATRNGNGGKVIVWSDDATVYSGSAFVRGGKEGGDGGLVEVSGDFLSFEGMSDTTAVFGKTGTLLLDPSDITVAAADLNYTFTNTGVMCAGQPTSLLNITVPGAVTILNTTLNTQLATNCVTLNTSATGNGGGTGVITVSSAVSWAATTTLTLMADSVISIGATITNSWAGAATSFDAMNFTALNTPLAGAPGVNVGAVLSCTGNGGNIVLSGVGGTGVFSGVEVASAITTTTGNITFTNSMGGTGGGGSNRGVDVASVVSSTSGSILFTGCTGGAGGLSVGVRVFANITTGGAVTFTNCVGGGSGGTCAGVRAEGGTIDAPTITAVTGIMGGNSANPNNHGFHVIGGTVGSANTTNLSITATGGGTVNSEQGIRVDSGTIQVGNTGVMTLVGFGSTTGVNSCTGLDLEAAGTITGGNTATLSLTGTGGGSGAGNNNFGVAIGGVLSAGSVGTVANIILNGTAGGGTGGTNRGTVSLVGGNITLLGTGTITISGMGGAATGVGNTGVDLNCPITAVTGSLVFTNCFGGSNPAGSRCHGLRFQPLATNDVQTITGISNIRGGTGATCFGLTLDAGATIGSANTTSLTFTGTSLGSASSRGINNVGTIQIGNTGTLTLHGTGSAASTTAGVGILISGTGVVSGGNAAVLTLTGIGGSTAATSGTGISMAGTVSAGTGAASTATITFTGVGSAGTVGPNHGANLSAGTVTLLGTGSVNFNNCMGGTLAGTSNGVNIINTITASNGTVNFSNCQGGSSGSNNRGVQISTPAMVTANSVTASAVLGGAGDNSVGFQVDSGAILQTAAGSANNISLTATGGASGANCYGIYLTGAGSTISTSMGTGNVILTGTGGSGANAIVIDATGATPLHSNTGAISLVSGGGSIGLGNTTITKTGAGANGISFTGPVELLANTPTVTAAGTGPIFFSSTIDGAFSLTENAGGAVTFAGAIGSITPPVSLSLTGTQFNVGGDITLSGASLTFPSPVNLIGDSNMTVASGGTMTFNSTVDGGSNFGVDVGPAGSAVFNAPLGGSVNLGSLTVTGIVNLPGLPFTATTSGDITLNQLVLTADAVNGGDIDLTSSGGTITVNDIDASGTAGNGGHIYLQPGPGSTSTSLGTTPRGILVFEGTSVVSNGGVTPGNIRLAAAGRTTPQSIATIVGMQNLTITGGTFLMGLNESMTVLGDLTIDPFVVTLSDIITLGFLSVTGSSITLNPQPPAIYLASNGMFYISPNAHIITGGGSTFSIAVLPADARIQLTSLSLSDLVRAGVVLNYDFVNFNTFFQLVFDMAVANAQMGRLFPIIKPLSKRPFPVYRICTSEEVEERPCVIDFEPFIFESDIMTDASREKLGL